MEPCYSEKKFPDEEWRDRECSGYPGVSTAGITGIFPGATRDVTSEWRSSVQGFLKPEKVSLLSFGKTPALIHLHVSSAKPNWSVRELICVVPSNRWGKFVAAAIAYLH